MKRVVVVLLLIVLVTLIVAPAFAKQGRGSTCSIESGWQTGRRGGRERVWRWHCSCGAHGSWVGFDWQAKAAWKIHKLLKH